MRAIIVAAGRGDRMRPYTDNRPKCLIPFAGRTLLDWQIAALKANGVHDIGLVRGYLGECFDGLGLGMWNNSRWEETNMVYSLLCAREALGEVKDGVIVSYGDIVYEPCVVKALLETPGDIVVAVDRNWLRLWQARVEDPLEDAESLRIDEGRLIDIGRKAASVEEIEAQYIGLMRFAPAGIRNLIDFFDSGQPGAPWLMGRTLEKCYMTDVLFGMIQAGNRLMAATIEGGWLEFDTEADLLLYNRLLKEGTLRDFLDLQGGTGQW